MGANEVVPATEQTPPQRTRRRHVLRATILALWALVVVFQWLDTFRDPSVSGIIATGAFSLLCLVVNAQLYLLQWSGNRNWRRITSRLHGSAYLSELHNLPNRNYLLSELRREMPRARNAGKPFVLLQISLDTLDEVAERRGEEFADRARNALCDLIKRVTRNSDFIAHVGGARLSIMLNECTAEQSFIYLRRVPATIAVSDGRNMFEVPVTVRLHEYDMEALYATDVLREVEEAKPLRRKEQSERPFTNAA